MTTGENVLENGRDGLFFLPNIQKISSHETLDRIELTFWLGRGAFLGMSEKAARELQDDINEQRARLNGAEVLAQAE